MIEINAFDFFRYLKRLRVAYQLWLSPVAGARAKAAPVPANPAERKALYETIGGGTSHAQTPAD